jgi:hypothetical protein
MYLLSAVYRPLHHKGFLRRNPIPCSSSITNAKLSAITRVQEYDIVAREVQSLAWPSIQSNNETSSITTHLTIIRVIRESPRLCDGAAAACSYTPYQQLGLRSRSCPRALGFTRIKNDAENFIPLTNLYFNFLSALLTWRLNRIFICYTFVGMCWCTLCHLLIHERGVGQHKTYTSGNPARSWYKQWTSLK